jgi:hypothetical protein
MANSLGVEAHARKPTESPPTGKRGSRSALAFKLGTLFVCAMLTYCSSSTTSPPKLDASSAFDGGASGRADAGADALVQGVTDTGVNFFPSDAHVNTDAYDPCRRDAGAVNGDCCLDNSDCSDLCCEPGGSGYFDGGKICMNCPMK